MASNLNSGSPLLPGGGGSLSLPAPLMAILRAAASLKLTVVLFLLAIFIIFAGTLAQVNHDIWKVVHDYFRTAIAWIDLQIFFPKSWFPSMPVPAGQYYFPAPGGWLIGCLMVINLVAAHALRFKVQASGARVAAGLGVLGIGVFVTWLVIYSGSKDGLQGVPFFEWSTLWTALEASLGLSCVIAAVGAMRLDRAQSIERGVLVAISLVLGGLVGWLVYRGEEVEMTASSMRILWQLLQAEFASLVLLAGCFLLFKKRAGIVLLHSGVGLMMFSELLVGLYAEEAQMHIKEGETVNFAQDIRKLELAVVMPKDTAEDDVVAIPESLLRRDKPIHDESLPFDVEVVQFLQNARVRPIQPGDKHQATAGAGLQLVAELDRAGTGTDTDSKVDMSAAYVKLLKKGSSEPIGVYLVSLFQSMRDLPERVTVDGKACDLFLRFKRIYKPYSMHLVDVRFDKYIGTDTARNYSSDLQLVDGTRNVDREVKIWMNNPLRFAGETFYQSSFNVDPNTGTEMTGLQVVSNTGWMIPYVACMIVVTGMLSQFLTVLLRFLKRRQAALSTGTLGNAEPSDGFLGESERIIDRGRPGTGVRPRLAEAGRSAKPIGTRNEDFEAGGGWFLSLFAVIASLVFVASLAPIPATPKGEMDLYEFGKLPIVFEGREKPIDTLARNMLRIISDKETFVDEAGRSQPAIRWLLDVISAKPVDGAQGLPLAEKHKVFRIENLDLLDTLKLPRRNRYRYAIDELRPRIEEFERQAKLAHELKPDQLSVYQRKVLELDRKIRKYTLLLAAFRPPHLPELPTEEDFRRDPAKAKAQLTELQQVMTMASQRLRSANPPLAVPVEPVEPAPAGGTKPEAEWKAYAMAWITAYLQTKVMGREPDPATASWNGMLVSYVKGDANTFNRHVAGYATLLKQDPPPLVNLAKTRFEAWFNHMSPFFYIASMYLIAFLVALLSWLIDAFQKSLNRAVFCMIVTTFLFHTAALIARIYISGRPPVTNLYSSAVFIGWGCVLLSIILEKFFRLGIGNVVGAGSGFATLLIAHFLAGDGDTFVVLQAVLDTQFWLATHVTCVTLGYATTFLAGQLGMFYVLRGMLTPTLSADVAKKQSRMIYGTLCFAIFFSFFGTVLGGLWADDSWGRFWGWDPKENGALIIVLWNALVLHARWDGMVKDRGMAVLAVAGNIATSWSWFGVNELGVGLHSYGFTEGVLKMLGLYVLSQLVVIGLGLLPKRMWWSFRRDPIPSAELA